MAKNPVNDEKLNSTTYQEWYTTRFPTDLFQDISGKELKNAQKDFTAGLGEWTPGAVVDEGLDRAARVLANQHRAPITPMPVFKEKEPAPTGWFGLFHKQKSKRPEESPAARPDSPSKKNR